MARRKKEVVELESVEELETSNEESAENESNEAELLNDSQTRNISLSEVEAESESESEEEVEALEVEASEAEDKPKRQRRSRKKANDAEGTEITSAAASKIEKNLKKDMDAAQKAIETSMESMLKQWHAVKEVTSHITQNLEKISTQVQVKTGQSLDEFLLPKKEEKPSFLTKFAICASVIATLFSVLSLTMAQSTRQSVLNAELTRAQNPVVQNAPEVAFNNSKRSEKKRK